MCGYMHDKLNALYIWDILMSKYSQNFFSFLTVCNYMHTPITNGQCWLQSTPFHFKEHSLSIFKCLAKLVIASSWQFLCIRILGHARIHKVLGLLKIKAHTLKWMYQWQHYNIGLGTTRAVILLCEILFLILVLRHNVHLLRCFYIVFMQIITSNASVNDAHSLHVDKGYLCGCKWAHFS